METFLSLSKRKSVFVVPAFETKLGEIPSTKKEIKQLWKKKLAQQIALQTHAPSHRATDYVKWFETETIYSIQYEMYYEPYVVSRKTIPSYSEMFRGYGNDKDQLFAELDVRHYKFYVLPNVFVVHWQHQPTEWAFHKPNHGRKWRNYSFWFQELLLQVKTEIKKEDCSQKVEELCQQLFDINMQLEKCTSELETEQSEKN